MKNAVALTFLVCLATPALADVATDVLNCSKVAGKDNRLDCYDHIADRLPAPEPSPAPGAAVGALLNAVDVKRLAPTDLAVETHKWEGKVVETTLNCLYADAADFRCFDTRGLARVRVDFNSFNDAGSGYLQLRCDTSSAADTRACLVKLRFIYESSHRQDVGGLLGVMLFIEPRDGYGEIVR